MFIFEKEMILVLWLTLLCSVSVLSFSDNTTSDFDHLERMIRSNRPRCAYRRVRKEVREMTPKEWRRYVGAINKLKRKGIYDDLAEIHRGNKRLKSAHGGPNFTGWHRILLLTYEDLLRAVHPCITIPYWDSSLDYYMKDPTKSIVWTNKFFGNGDNEVTSGPFANWVTGTGNNLTRNIGSGGTLATNERIEKILSRSSHSQIMYPSDAEYSIEVLHNGPHVWVSGQMNILAEAAEDPLFYMHHAFIDCIWYWFQEKLWKEQGINSYYDYPDHGELRAHRPNRKMDPFAKMKGYLGITNRDGYRNKYYKGLYTCKPMPTCSKSKPSCGSPYLRCDQKRNRCVSKKGSPLKYQKHPPSKFELMRKTTRPAMALGEKFVSDVVDPRNRGDPLPQRLPDSNLHAMSDQKLLQKLARDIHDL